MKILLAAGIAVIAIAGLGTAGFLTSVESATIDITLPAWRLDSWSEVHGASSGGQFQTQRAQVTLSDTAAGTATGSELAGGSYARGYVTVTHRCYAPVCIVTPVPAGAEVCSVPYPPSTLSLCFVLEAADTCLCGQSIPVRAESPGAAYNLPRNNIHIPSWTEPTNTLFTVNNPEPTAGGADPTAQPIVTQSDINAAVARARAQLSIDLQSALLVKGGGLVHVIPDGTPSMTVTPNVAAGAHTATFQVTATGTLGATEFRDADATRMIAKGIDLWVPAGFRLNGAPVVTDYQVLNADQQGNVTVSGEALDYLVANFSTDALRARLRGLSTDVARSMVATAAPGSRVSIYLTPSAAPLLPLDASRISISLTLEAAR